MGRGREWMGWGAVVFALNLAWEIGVYLSQAWPIPYPFVGMAVGALLVLIGVVWSAVGRLKRAEPGAAPDRGP